MDASANPGSKRKSRVCENCGAPQLQKGYDAVWSGFKKRFE